MKPDPAMAEMAGAPAYRRTGIRTSGEPAVPLAAILRIAGSDYIIFNLCIL